MSEPATANPIGTEADLREALRRLLKASEEPWARAEMLDAMEAARAALAKAEGRP